LHNNNPKKRVSMTLLLSILVAFLALNGINSTLAAGFSGMQIQGNSKQIADSLGLKNTSGVWVRDVAVGGPAAIAGFRRGDLITSFEGVPIDSFDLLVVMIGKTKPGQKVKFGVQRGKEKLSLAMRLSKRPDQYKVSKNATTILPVFGLTMASITPKIRKRFALRWASVGVLITLVDDQFKTTLGLKRGDVIVQINRQDIWEPSQVIALYKRAKANKKKRLLLLVDRQGSYVFKLLAVK